MPTPDEVAALRIAVLLDLASYETGDLFELVDGVEPEELRALLDEIDFDRRWATEPPQW